KRKGSDSGGTQSSGFAQSSAKKTKTSTHLQWDSSVVDHAQECRSHTRHTNCTTFLDMTYSKTPQQDVDVGSSPGSLAGINENRYRLAKLPFETDIDHNDKINGSSNALSTEMKNMRGFFQQQFNFLQQEMSKEFRSQRMLLEGLKKDMMDLKYDNDRVRRE